ncbi:MAG: TraR/DksA C4-type zinc finger protein [Alphaproteobacteria bacterium]|nr:TraR/DksA C4-type zinc finger protein [Alphaproteobacteria bacterium]
MADEIDKAQAADLAHTEAAIKRHAANRSHRESRKHCFTCGERIDEARRLAVSGCQRCVECQGQFERGLQ